MSLPYYPRLLLPQLPSYSPDSIQQHADIGSPTRPEYRAISDENIVALSLNIVANFAGLDSTTAMATALVSGALEKHRQFPKSRSECPIVGSVVSDPEVEETASATGNDVALDRAAQSAASASEAALASWSGPAGPPAPRPGASADPRRRVDDRSSSFSFRIDGCLSRITSPVITAADIEQCVKEEKVIVLFDRTNVTCL